jgi:hypothetical protein
MKWGVEIREHHAFETHLNLMRDFTGSRERMSVITSRGRQSDIVRQWKRAALAELKRGEVKSGQIVASDLLTRKTNQSLKEKVFF